MGLKNKPRIFTRGETAYLTGRWFVDHYGHLMVEVSFPKGIFIYATKFINEFEIFEIQGDRNW